MNKKKINVDLVRLGLLLLVALACMMAFVLVQPLGDGPDEIDRYKVVQYIYNHGTLPVGDDSEVLLEGYGGSYAFQPILTYIIQGYLLRALRVFDLSELTMLVIARLVCVATGLTAVVYTWLIGRQLFEDKRVAYLFTVAVTMLPQNLFVHTYVNTDSMGLLSVAIVIYATIRGIKTMYDIPSVVNLILGISICALSYYNCYGVVLAAAITMIVYYCREGRRGIVELVSKAGIIIFGVMILAGWWFIRNGILYDGDILALKARQLCAAETALPEYNPLTRDTYYRLGIPLTTMIWGTDYYTLCWKSFIAMFGPMRIPTSHYIYMTYKYLCIVALAGLIIPRKKLEMPENREISQGDRSVITIMMLVSGLIPVVLALYYSYTWEFQPQGRYYLPMVIPFMLLMTLGMRKVIALISMPFRKLSRGKIFESLLYHGMYALIVLMTLYSVFFAMLRYYGRV
ncbi:MAG: glycosyltransferase family 39 protein [Lachnospiraceae bacterium]|nr:glycosyltransferase family 39 protein [Lachnospiraceae bacterium]